MLLVSCSSDVEQASDLYQRGLSDLQAGKKRSAVVNFKAALKTSPEAPEIRWELGRLYYQLGLAHNALKELERARNLGHDAAELDTLLLRARLETGNYEWIIETYDPIRASLSPTRRALLGVAEYHLGHFEQAKAHFAAAQEVEPDNPDVLLGRAALERYLGNVDAALALVNTVSVRYENNFDAWLLKGVMHAKETDWPAAASAFQKAVVLREGHVRAIEYLAGALVRNQQFDEAEEELKKLPDKSAETLLIAAYIALGRDKEDDARTLLTEAVALSPGAAEPAVVLGVIQQRRGEANQAISYYTAALNSTPEYASVYRYLASVYVTIGDPMSAIAALVAGLPYNANDPYYLRVLSGLELDTGNAVKALEYAKAAVVASGETKERAQSASLLGWIHTSRGQLDEALAAYENRQEFEKSLEADVEVIYARLRAGELEQARQDADALLQSDPKNPDYLWLVGSIAQRQGDLQTARSSFEAALLGDPDHPKSLEALGHLFVNSKDYDAARKIFEAVVTDRASNWESALLNVAAIEMTEGKEELAVEHYRRLTKERPYDPRAFVELAKLELRDRNADAAIELAEIARTVEPTFGLLYPILASGYYAKRDYVATADVAMLGLRVLGHHTGLLRMLVRSRWELGQREEAIRIMEIETTSFPEVFMLRVQFAALLRELGRYDEARVEIDAASGLEPDSLPLLVETSKLELELGNVDIAQSHLKKVLAADPNRVDALKLVAQLESGRGRHAAAIGHYERALRVSNSADIAIELFRVRLDSGAAADAVSGLAQWVRDHDTQWRSRFTLAAHLHVTGDLDAALHHYQKLLELNPDHAMVHNNLALLHLSQGHSAESKAAANRAIALRPSSRIVRDTVAWVAAETGELETARAKFHSLLQQEPGFQSARYHYAVVLAKLGDLGAARRNLDTLLDSDSAFPEREQAQALRAQL